MTIQYDSRSVDSYKEQLKRIQSELEEIINDIEEKEQTNSNGEEEIDKDKNTYKTEGYNNSIQLNRKNKQHLSRSPNTHQLDSTIDITVDQNNDF